MVQLARDLRLAVTQNVFDQGLITEDEAREILSGPLTPGDDTTIYDDSTLLRSRLTSLRVDAAITPAVDGSERAAPRLNSKR